MILSGHNTQESGMNNRMLGIIVILGGLAAGLNGFRPDNVDERGSVPLILWAIGGVCGVVGMLRLNAIGFSPLARAFGLVPLVGFVTLIVHIGLKFAGAGLAGATWFDVMAAVGWISILAGMLLVGILTIAARVWHGWQRFVPLSTVLIIPLSVGLNALLGSMTGSAVLPFLIWVVIGYVIVLAEPPAAVGQQLPV
jgi:hypothetical protein